MIPKVSYNVCASSLVIKKNNQKQVNFGNGSEKYIGEKISNSLQLLIFRAKVCKKDPNLLRKEAIEKIISIFEENPQKPLIEIIEQLKKEAQKL